MANYERYQSLVKEAWQHYSQGDRAGMARSLEESLEYTPYLKSETISNWLSEFSKYSWLSKHNFDADFISELTDWQDITSDYLRQKNQECKILIVGHDLRFVMPLINYYRSKYPVITDKWQTTNKHDAKISSQLIEKPDIIICEWCCGNAVWYSHRKKNHQKLFIRVHKFELFTEYPSQVKWENVDGVIFIAPKMKEIALSKFNINANSYLIYNWVDTNKFDIVKTPEHKFNLGLLGYLPKIKRIDLAIEVLLKLRKKDQRYKLFVKGKHPSELTWVWNNQAEKDYYEKILEKANSEALKDCIVFDGYGHDVPNWFQQIGYILSVSDVEGSHQAVAEGMSSGAIPMISGGFYHDYGAASLYPQRYCCESIDDIVRRIHFLNQDELLRLSLQKEVKEYAQRNFDAQVISEQWDNLLLNKPSSFSSQLVYSERDCTKILLYADINLNVIDGSSVWLTSLINTLAIEKSFKISLLLKSSLFTSKVINNIEEINNIEIIDPFAGRGLLSAFQNNKELTVKDAMRCLIDLDKNRSFDTICIRSSQAAKLLKDRKDIVKKCIFYSLKSINTEDLEVLNNSKYIASQTELLADHYVNRGIHKNKIFILPPIIKDIEKANVSFKPKNYDLVYSGKLSAGYNAIEIIKAFKHKLAHRKNYRLHLIVAKIMRNDEPIYTKELKNLLQNNDDERIKIYYELTRDEVINIIRECDLGISWRSPQFDSSLELSTKTLEYSSLGKPVIVNRNPINESLLGKDYPLYANTEDEFCQKVELALSDQDIFHKASRTVFLKSQDYMFSIVHKKIKTYFMKDECVSW